jgi:hypothetical protein
MQTLHLKCKSFRPAIRECRSCSSPFSGSAAKRAAVTAARRIWPPNQGPRAIFARGRRAKRRVGRPILPCRLAGGRGSGVWTDGEGDGGWRRLSRLSDSLCFRSAFASGPRAMTAGSPCGAPCNGQRGRPATGTSWCVPPLKHFIQTT